MIFKGLFSKSNDTHAEITFGIILICLGIAGVFLMMYLTPYGMGLVNDLTAYIGGAQNLLEGMGYSRTGGDGRPLPITHFPPMFTFVLISVSLTGLEVIRAARLINVLLFGANIMLMGFSVRKLTGSNFFALFGALLFLLSEPLLRTHSFALSEPLYLFISFIVFWTLITYQSSHRWGWIAVTAALCGAGYLTRYVGLTLGVTVFALVLALAPTWKQRLRDGLVFIVFILPGPLAWSLRNLLVTGNATNRPIDWHPPADDRIREGLLNFWNWLLPDTLQKFFEYRMTILGILVLIIFTLLAAAAILLVYRRWTKPAQMLGESSLAALFFSAYAVIYLAGLIGAMTFIDANTTFEHRMLAPFYVSILILIIGGASWLWMQKQRYAKAVAALICLAFLFTFTEGTLPTIDELHSAGQGFASGRWRNSETMEVVRHLPLSKIFSNKITAIDLLANRSAYVIPWRFEPDLSKPDESYAQGVENYRQQVLNGESVVVIFDYDAAISGGDVRVIDITRDLPLIGKYSDGGYLWDKEVKQRLAFWICLLILGIAAILLLRYITPYGLGLVNDSVGYIAGARNLLAGNGYSRLNGDYNITPITNYPPLFPMLIAFLGLFGLGAIRAARLINILCFTANVTLSGVVIIKLTRSPAFALLGALLFLVSEAFLEIHSFALTEPLYLFLSFTALLLLVEYLLRNTVQSGENSASVF